MYVEKATSSVVTKNANVGTVRVAHTSTYIFGVSSFHEQPRSVKRLNNLKWAVCVRAETTKTLSTAPHGEEAMKLTPGNEKKIIISMLTSIKEL